MGRLALRFCVALGVLLAPWPGLGELYRKALAAVLNQLGGLTFPVTLAFGEPGSAPGSAHPVPASWSLLVRAQDAISGRSLDTQLDLRRTTYIATAVFVALVLASPLPGRARLAFLAKGVPALTALVLLPLLAFFSGPLPLQAFPVGQVASAALQLAYHVLITPPAMAYVLPALLFAGLFWRRSSPTPATGRRPDVATGSARGSSTSAAPRCS